MTLLVAVVSAEHLEREAVFAALTKRGAKPVFGSETLLELPVNGLDGVSVVFHSIQSPGKPDRAASAYKATMEILGTSRFDLAIFVGTAGALDTKQEFPIGQIVIPREVVWDPGHPEAAACGGSDDEVFRPDPELMTLADDSPAWRSADRLVTVSRVVSTDSERARLLQLDGKPLVVAMEDAGFLRAANERSTPAASVRAVMDHVTDRVNEVQKDRNKKRASRAAAEAAIDLVMKYRLSHGFNEKYATSVHQARDGKKAEANQESLIQGLIRHVTGDAQLQLSLSQHDRVDIIGDDLLIEVERDLRLPAKLEEGLGQIQRYLDRAHKAGLGIASGFVTDGVEWRYFQRTSDGVHPIGSPFVLRNADADTKRLVGWINDHLGASTEKKTPIPELIERFLGAKSPTRSGDRLVLADMWRELTTDSEAQLKRSLWAQSLSTALGTQFTNSDDLFIDHTYLVLLAELIANSVVGVNITDPELDVTRLVTGAEFADSWRIEGVVEADFFDWPLHSALAETFVRRLASRVDKFDWSGLEHDALKHLYESVIDAKTRKALGEYYTPDWLAKQVVAEVVAKPLGHRVLDPSCGSGTFVFHAVQRYLDAAEEAGVPVGQAVVDVTHSVYGFDLHPVAVALARVTYILAIGADRLAQRSSMDPLQIPVFLADSLRWDALESAGTLDEGTLVIEVSEAALSNLGTVMPGTLQFRFPEALLDDPESFDKVVNAMHAYAHNKSDTRESLFKRFAEVGVVKGTPAFDTLSGTARNLRSLVESNLDGIWSYYLRNQARPAWLALQGSEGDGVDYLVGNPPWLGYKTMPKSMQQGFTAMMSNRGLAAKGNAASGQDLSSLFVARSAELYLRIGGTFGFVLPHSAIRQRNFERFRSGEWSAHTGKGRHRIKQVEVNAQLGVAWDVGTLASPPFPITSSVVFGERTGGEPVPMPREVDVLDDREGARTRRSRAESASSSSASAYADSFRQGATLTPVFLAYVEATPGKLAISRHVKSQRSAQEDDRWKDVPAVEGDVQKDFVFAVHRGQTTIPFGFLPPSTAVLPIVSGSELSDDPPVGVRDWWATVSAIWDEGKKDTYVGRSLLDRLNYSRGLGNQLPLGDVRVVYTRAGRTVAAVMTEPAIVDNTLYWGRVSSMEEADYLAAILNSDALFKATEEHSITGLFGVRDTHKNQFKSPIPTFSTDVPEHVVLAALGREAREKVAAWLLPEDTHFVTARKHVRKHLEASDITTQIEASVAALLGSTIMGDMA